MSTNATNTTPLELQPSLVLKFIKKNIDEDYLISSNFKKVFSRCLTMFIFYLMTIANGSSREKNRATVTIDDLRKSLEEMDFEEEILKKINSSVLDYKSKDYKSKSKRKINIQKKDEFEIEEVQIESEIENEEVISEKDDAMDEEIKEGVEKIDKGLIIQGENHYSDQIKDDELMEERIEKF
jgi:hypothetical protein